MSWFSFTDIAKNALSEAQKKIDKALDIQHDGSNHIRQTTSSLRGDELSKDNFEPRIAENAPANTTKITQIKKADFSSKKKSRPNKLGASSLKAKRVAKDEDDDLFSMLNEDVNLDRKTSRQKRETSESNLDVSLKSEISDNESKLDENAKLEESSLNEQRQSVTVSEEEFSEVPLIVPSGGALDLDSPIEALPDSEVIETQQSYVEPTLVHAPVQDPSPESSSQESERTELTISDSIPHSDETVAADDLKLQNKAMAVDENTNEAEEKLSKSSISKPEEEPTNCRTVSPASSTAASSEIDILDHESTISEVSSISKYADGQIFIQSPLHIGNIDSDASQAFSPINVDNRSSNTSSPQLTTDAQNVDADDKNIPRHSFQPVEKPESSSIEESSNIPVNDAGVSAVMTQEDVASTENAESSADKKGNNTVLDKEENDRYLVLCEKMEVYEQQLFNLSCRNAQLNEENDNLRSEISRTKELCEKDAVKQMEEMTDNLSSVQNNNQLLKEEKNNLMKQMAVLKSQLASRMTNEQVQNAIAEKEESIKGLMEEGEALSKKHLQQSNLIKKMKSQLQEKESDLKISKEKIVTFTEENAKLKDALLIAQGQGKEVRETSMRISDAYEQRERETLLLQEKLADAEEKQRTLQVNLDAAYVEIGDLHKQKAEQESKWLSELNQKEGELQRMNELEIKKIISEQEHQRQLLLLQMMELNNNVSRTEAMVARKEDDHRREIRDLQQRLQESENRNQDLSDNVSSATRPLLRQIENLQSTHSSQQRTWNALEKTLNNRLGEAQAELHAARESERVAQSAAIEAKSRAVAYEKQIENDQDALAKLNTDIQMQQKKISELEGECSVLREELAEIKETHRNLIMKSKHERLSLENQLQMEKVRSEADKKKYIAQQESMQKERERFMWSRSEITSVSSNQIVETESVDSSNDTFHHSDTIDKQLFSSYPGLVHHPSFEAPRSVSNVLENLQTQLKLRDGELAQLRGEINMLERTRSSMAEEIVRLTNLNEDMEGVSKELEGAEEKLQEVEGRYSALLTMYGEKEEENEELRMDLDDVKAMYRQQIDSLLKSELT